MVSQSTENLWVQFNQYLLVQLIRIYLVSLVLSAVMDNPNGLTHISTGQEDPDDQYSDSDFVCEALDDIDWETFRDF